MKSEAPSLRKWVAIYAIYKFEFSPDDPFQYYDFISDSKNSRYAVIKFSIPINTIEISDGIDDRDITIIKLETMNSEEDINIFLKKKSHFPGTFYTAMAMRLPLVVLNYKGDRLMGVPEQVQKYMGKTK